MPLLTLVGYLTGVISNNTQGTEMSKHPDSNL